MSGAASAWLTLHGIAVVIGCVLLAAEGRWGWAVVLFLLSFVVDVLVVVVTRRRARRLRERQRSLP